MSNPFSDPPNLLGILVPSELMAKLGWKGGSVFKKKINNSVDVLYFEVLVVWID